MLRESLLYLSDSTAANRIVTSTPFARRLAERFVAGETLEDAIRVARASNKQGLTVSLDFLGEAVGSREEAVGSGQSRNRGIGSGQPAVAK